MDYFTNRELAQMKSEEQVINNTIEADKFAFQHKLEGGFGKKMMEELNNPKKPSFWVGLQYRLKRWRTIRKCKKEERKMKKGGI